MGVEGEERRGRRERKKERETETDTKPHYITSHTTHTHLPFLPLSVVFLIFMIISDRFWPLMSVFVVAFFVCQALQPTVILKVV